MQNKQFYKKIALSNPNLLELEHCKEFETTRSEKNQGSLVQHGKWKDHENGKDWKGVIRYARKDFPSDKNGDELDKKEGDY